MKKMMRRMLCLTMAVMLVLSATVGAMAANYEAGTYEELENAFAGSANPEGDTTVNVNVTGDIGSGGNVLATKEGWSYAVGSTNSSTVTNIGFSGGGSVEIAGEIIDSSVRTSEGVTVTVNGDVNGQVSAEGGSTVTVEGNVTNETGVGVYSDGGTVKVTGEVTGGNIGVSAMNGSDVTVGGNVTGENNEGVYSDGSTVKVTGEVTGGNIGVSAMNGSDVTVGGNVTGENNEGVYSDGSTVKVTGEVTGGRVGVSAWNGSDVTVGGNVTGENNEGVYSDGSTVKVTGEVTGGNIGVSAWNGSDVTVDGNVAGLDGDPEAVDYSDPKDFSDGGNGAYVNDSTLEVTGNVTGGNGYGTNGWGGTALGVNGISNVKVHGNAVGGSVTADPATKGETEFWSYAGDGVDMDDPESTVYIGGNAIGGSTNGDGGYAGHGVIVEVEETDNPAGSLTVVGTAIGGKAENGHPGEGLHVDNDDTEIALQDKTIPTIKLGGYDSLGAEDVTDAELEELSRITGLPFRKVEVSVDSETGTFWGGVIRQIRRAEKGTTLTIDAEGRTTMPATVAEAVKECGVTLIIQWDGGEDITIDADFNKAAVDGVYLLKDL